MPRLIIGCATSDEAPPGYTAAWKLGPMYLADPPDRIGGQAKPRRIVVIRHPERHEPIYCPLVPDVSPHLVEQERRDFLIWCGGLKLIVERAPKLGLKRWRITGPARPPATWEEKGIPIDGLTEAGLEP